MKVPRAGWAKSSPKGSTRFCSGIADYPHAGLRWPTYHEPLLESPLNPFDLTGRVAIVTGGNGGLGLAMARGLARAGASIALAARDESKGQAALKDLISSAPRTRFYAFQASSASSCRKLIETVARDFGGCDILINFGTGVARDFGRQSRRRIV